MTILMLFRLAVGNIKGTVGVGVGRSINANYFSVGGKVPQLHNANFSHLHTNSAIRFQDRLSKCREKFRQFCSQNSTKQYRSSIGICVFKPIRSILICGVPGLTFIRNWRRKDTSPTHSEEALALIPKEVLQKEKNKKKQHRGVIVRLLLFVWEALRYTLRTARIILTFGPLLSIYPMICWSQTLKYMYWKVMLFFLEVTGPAFIKLGQWAGTRRDLFSTEFCDLFSQLHVRTRTHAWHITKKKLRKAFGKRWREVLVKIHKRPCGSGCIAQVHKAYMRPDMIPDEALVDEIMQDCEEESDEPEIDFLDGLEIVGLGGLQDEFDDMVEEIQANKQKGGPTTTDSTDQSDEHSSLDISQAQLKTPPGGNIEDDEAQLVPVAVKVLHPGVYRAVQRDLRILTRLVWLTEKLIPGAKWLSLHDCMEEVSDLLMRQIDLRMEAECLEQFNENFQDHPNIRFPKPVWPFCKRGVLVETFEEGEPLTNFLCEDTDEKQEGLKEKLASFGVDALLQMVFVDNFVHGDLHPGNILVQNAKDYVHQDENKLMLIDVGDTVIVNLKPVECPVRLVMLDVGITTSLSESDLDNFRAVFTAVVIGEGSKVAELMLHHSRYSECKNVEAFKEELGSIVMKARQETLNLGTVQAGKLLSQVFSTLSRHKVKMESNFASILLAIFILEGLGRSLDPEMDILERAKPILLS